MTISSTKNPKHKAWNLSKNS